MIRTSDIINITDVLGIGVEHYAHERYPVGAVSVRFVGEKLFAYSRLRPRLGREIVSKSQYIDGNGDNVVEFNIVRDGDILIVFNLWITLYLVTYLEINGEVIFDKR